jgi:hypothetical protein
MLTKTKHEQISRKRLRAAIVAPPPALEAGAEGKMASDRQIEANRRNAQLSTGPRTDEGKAKSSGNAMRHGPTAQTAFLPGEDEEEFASLRQKLIAALDPRDALEFELAERNISVFWRLRRVP